MNVVPPKSPHLSDLPAGDGPLSATSEPEADGSDARYLAHDVRNWLTTLQVYCDLLRTSGVIASGYERWIEELSGAVRRGHGLVASMLESMEHAQNQTPPHAQNHVRTRTQTRQTEVSVHLSMESDKAGPVSLHGPRILRKSQGSQAARLAAGVDGEDVEMNGAPVSPQASASVDTSAFVDIGPALIRRLPLLQRLAGDHIEVEIDAPVNTGKAMVTEFALERILYNLVNNAIEAMPAGGRLRVTARRGNRHSGTGRRSDSLKASSRSNTSGQPEILLLRVTDTGRGIAPEFLPTIFEAGVSGKVQGKNLSGLHGYGLAIVRELAERAGGAVRVRSHPGCGSCFEVKLLRA